MKKLVLLLLGLSGFIAALAQEEPTVKKEEIAASAKEEHKHAKEEHKHIRGILEAELEIYPVNILHVTDRLVKNEAMIDYHLFSKNERQIFGMRFFVDEITHLGEKRHMKDLFIYTQIYYGFKIFQLGAEIGSVTGQHYISFGPQYTHYDASLFKRISLITRVFPDYLIGYEYTTKELEVFHGTYLSSTGTGRMVLPCNQQVIQASIWVSFDKLEGLYFGAEYEYNNASEFNHFKFETPSEFFVGVKAEL